MSCFACGLNSRQRPGNGNGTRIYVDAEEWENIKDRTSLSENEMQDLSLRYSKIVGKSKKMTRQQFYSSLGILGVLEDTLLPDRIFSGFDLDGDGLLCFSEFVTNLNFMLRGTEDEKLELSFRFFDAEKEGQVGFRDFRKLLEACRKILRVFSPAFEDDEVYSAGGRRWTRNPDEDEDDLQKLFSDLVGENSYLTIENFKEGVRNNFKFLEYLGLHPSYFDMKRDRGSVVVKSVEASSTPLPVRESSAVIVHRISEEFKKLIFNSLSQNDANSMYVDIKQVENILRRLSLLQKSSSSSAGPSEETNGACHDPLIIENLGVSSSSVLAAVSSTPPSFTFDTAAAKNVANKVIASSVGTPPQSAGLSQSREIYSSFASRSGSKKALLGPPKGSAVYFGHENWNMVLNMMIGIRMSLGRGFLEISRQVQDFDFLVKDKFTILPALNNFFDSQVSRKIQVMRFVDYAPLVFKSIRRFSGVASEIYLRSVGPEQLIGNLILGNLSSLAELSTEGKSGAFFYYTSDGHFLLKTISKHEKKRLKSMLPSYFSHLNQNPQSLLVRIYGLHALRLKKKTAFGNSIKSTDGSFYFVVMGNLFNTSMEISRRYDLKGSWVDRSVGSKKGQNENPSEKLSNVALKDKDFLKNENDKFKMKKENRKKLLQQLEQDAQFLEEHEIIDYSLLLGIHDEGSDSNDQETFQPTDSKLVPFSHLVSESERKQVFLGVIDILIQYNAKKKMERAWKIFSLNDSQGISCMPPREYKERFLKFLSEKVFIERNEDDVMQEIAKDERVSEDQELSSNRV